MCSFVTFIHRTVWCLWLFLYLSFGISANKVSEVCREPQINSPSRSLHVYQLTDPIKVDVHHCFYREESICDQAECKHCENVILEGPVYKSRIDQYDDITEQCRNANNFTTFTDKYGRNHKINNQVRTKSICNGNAVLSRTAQATLKITEAIADTQADRILLSSGTICRYSAGFCHDRKENMEVVWKVTKSDLISCSHFTRLEVMEPYYFVINNVRYAIFQSRDRHHALELTIQEIFCNANMWLTRGRFIVSEGPLTEANNNAVDVPEGTGFCFENKQDMYDFLIDNCTANYDQSDGRRVFESEFFQSSFVKMQRQSSRLREMTEQVQRIKSEAEVFCYVVVSVLILLMVLMTLLAYFTLRKNYTTKKNVSDSSSDSTAIVANNYDYITSEYNINQFYKSK